MKFVILSIKICLIPSRHQEVRSSSGGSELRALVHKRSLSISGSEVNSGLVHLDVARADEIPTLLDVNEEFSGPAPLLAEEIEREEELPGLVEEGNSGALGGVDTLDLVIGEFAGKGNERELETESEEGGGLTGELLSLSNVGRLDGAVDLDNDIGARSFDGALEAGEEVKGE